MNEETREKLLDLVDTLLSTPSRIGYICDPKKNTVCQHTGCGYGEDDLYESDWRCFVTTVPEFAADNTEPFDLLEDYRSKKLYELKEVILNG